MIGDSSVGEFAEEFKMPKKKKSLFYSTNGQKMKK